ncbi:MAG: sulfite exporter TauE/SafE family protein [Polyangia bacterium]|jgi:uncharacterized membrane protein YfcA|nr:sulfite exporter TauE/SafE family protein [Polyangia bacterium]
MPELHILALLMVIVMAAFVAKGATGFGESLVMVPLFLLLLDMKLALPVALVATVAGDIYLIWQHHRDVHWPGMPVVLVTAVAGVILGTLLLQGLDGAILQKYFAALVIAFALNLFFLNKVSETLRKPHPLLGGLAGLSSGAIDAAFGTGGPPLVMYVSWLGLPRAAFRATLVLLAISLCSSRLVTYSLAGLMTRQVWLLGSLLVLPMILGALIGRLVHQRVNEALFRKMIALLLVVIGIKLLF